MAGLFAYAAAGAISGLGNALMEQARREREEALRQLAESQRRGPGGGGRAFRGGSSGGGSSRSPQVFGEYPGEDGILYGRTRSGEMVPYTMPDGSPMRVTDGERRSAAAPAGEPPKVMDTGPTMGAPPAAGDAGAMPEPKSLDEVRRLPSGTVFRAPDGSIRVVP